MRTPGDVLVAAGRLTAEGRPFVLATVVNVLRPASARRGDRALVTPDGLLAGWVGGACSEPVVVREALRALADGEARLIRIGPEESGCASEGTVEVLVEPQLPAPLLAVVGNSPAAGTLTALARDIGWRVSDAVSPDADAVVVASMGHGDEDALRAALDAEIGYVGLVASARRAASVLAGLEAAGVGEEALARVRSPAGLDLGPSTQQEIAVAILAELVAWRHTHGEPPTPPAEAVDPVCGMTVAVQGAVESAVVGGETFYFCSSGCRRAYTRDRMSHA